MEPTKQNFITNYLSLTTGATSAIKEQANRNILIILNHPTVWNIGRELLKDDNPTYQFLGAQALYQKTSQQFRKMSIQQRQQLKQFIFLTEFDQKIQSFPVINKLASICGFISSQMIRSQWQKVIHDIAEVMKKNYQSFIKGLRILQQIPQQCKGMEKISFKEKIEIQQLFLKSEAKLIDIFITGLKNIQESRDLQTLLACIKSWSKFGIKILQNQILTQQLLIHFKGHKMGEIQEILTSALKLQFNSLKVQQIQSFATKSMLSQQSIQSLKILLQSLLKNKKQSPSYSYLLSSIITYFPWILSQSSQITKLLLQIMVSFVKSPSLDLKYSSIIFWISIIQQATQKASIIKLFILRDIISPYYSELFSIIVEQLKILSVNLLNHMDEQQQSLTDDQQQNNFHVVNINPEELKCQFSNLIQQLYIEMSKTMNKNIILQFVTSFLSTKQFIELGIFILRSITAVLQPSQILSSIITHILNLRSDNVSVKIQALRLIMTLDKSMINSTDVLKYVSQFFHNQKLSQHAIHTFYTLSTKMRHSSISQQFCEALFNVVSKDILTMNNTIDIQKVLSISFRIISEIKQISIMQTLLTNILKNSVISLQQLMNFTPYPKITIINNMILISSVVTQLENIKQINFQLFSKYSKEYCNTVIVLLTNLIVQLASKKDELYGPNNQLFYIIQIHQKCLRVLGKQLTVSINLLTMSCQLINKNIHNSELLNILSSTILSLSVINPHNTQQVTNQDNLNSWLQSHLKPLDIFLINSITVSYDPDLIRVYFYFQKALLQHNSTLINKNSLQLAYHCCTTIIQSDMLKEVIQFIEVYLYYCKDDNVATKLLNCVFKRFQVSPRVVCKLLIDVLQYKQQEDIRQKMYQLIRNKFQDMDQPQIQLLIRVFAFYILQKDINCLSQVLFDLEISHQELTKIREKYEHDRKIHKKK